MRPAIGTGRVRGPGGPKRDGSARDGGPNGGRGNNGHGNRRAPRRSAIVAGLVAAASAVIVLVLVAMSSLGTHPPRTAPRSVASSPGERTRWAPALVEPRWVTQAHDSPSRVWTVAPGVLVAQTSHLALVTPSGRVGWEIEVGRLEPVGATGAGTGAFATAEELLSVDLDAGRVRWRAALPERPDGVAVVGKGAGSAIVVATQGGGLASVAAADGRPGWAVRLDGRLRGDLAVSDAVSADAFPNPPDAQAGTSGTASPNATHGTAFDGSRPVAGQALVVGVWESDAGTVLRAVDADTGGIRWEQDLDSWASSPLVDGDRVVVGDGDGRRHARVRAFERDTGEMRWAASSPASFQPDLVPAVVGDRVVLADQLGTVSSYARSTGEVGWRRALGVPLLRARPIGVDGAIVLPTSDAVVTMARRGGTILSWRRLGGVPAGAALSGGNVVFGLRLVSRDAIQAYRADDLVRPVRPEA